ncbi:gamma-glutamyltransferase family protein [Actibacterium sp. 188UL27-1]|uniref:gamma-glutamyltransferase family protein n=1 Tax=Actibacterium sp. 188UL27-1 TaxID=2786961 RepID=UPI001958402C|nr:gamma-glutamyltransferase family protein [Actibacterium sp. 188UL27-1]MBM7066019.1 gamma-glutamyltransferase family protein [Actibacterium sp. 188UL27-1]
MRDFQTPGRSAVYAVNGMCATSHPLATATAIDILKQGGNAVDAAIAGSALLGLCEPQMTGLGGDCFALVKPAGSETVVALNGSGRAPAGMQSAALRAQGHAVIPDNSAHAVTLPGAVDGFCQLSERFGALDLGQCLAPAIAYAESGVPVAPRVAFDWAVAADRLQETARDRYLINGAAPRAGQVFRAPDQAEVLRRIAAEGRDGFYTGEVAEDLCAALTDAGGPHTLDDLAQTRATWETPIEGPYRDLQIVEHPPNSQGTAALLLAAILAEFDLGAMDPMSAEKLHIEAEAQKLAYDARNRIVADADHMANVEQLQRPSLAKELAGLIDPNRAMASAKQISEAVHKDTIYITVIDKDRMAVSLIYSIFHSFGSGLASKKFGLLLHNRGAGFTLEAGHPNEAAPGKRPMHTIIPGMLRKGGKIIAPFGVMGGQYQAAGHGRFASNLVDYGMDMQTALDAPRAFAIDGQFQLERGYGDDIRAKLADKGHRVVTPETAIGGAQTIRIDHDLGILEGASDPRKDGCALGY